MTPGVAPKPLPGEQEPLSSRSRSIPSRPVLEMAGVLAAFALAGLGAGWFWESHWTPTVGVVSGGEWYSGTRFEAGLLYNDFPSLTHYFDATAVFVLLGVGIGLVLGILTALMTRTGELVVLATVVVGSALACFLAYRLGVHLGPADPDLLAKTAPDLSILPTDLSVKAKSPFLGWTFGALLGLGVTYFLSTGLAESRRRERDGTRWLSRNQIG